MRTRKKRVLPGISFARQNNKETTMPHNTMDVCAAFPPAHLSNASTPIDQQQAFYHRINAIHTAIIPTSKYLLPDNSW
jgi:hypothetical protein